MSIMFEDIKFLNTIFLPQILAGVSNIKTFFQSFFCDVILFHFTAEKAEHDSFSLTFLSNGIVRDIREEKRVAFFRFLVAK